MKQISLVITAQSDHEKFEEVRALSKSFGIEHFHIDLKGAN